MVELFLAALAKTQDRDYATAEQEYEEGIHAVAAPVHVFAGHIIAAIKVTGSAYRLTTEKMHTIRPTVAASAEEVAAGLDVVGVSVH